MAYVSELPVPVRLGQPAPFGALGGLGGMAPTPVPGAADILGTPQAPAQQPGFFQSPGFGNALTALGMSLMASPANNPLAGFAPALAQREQQAAREEQMALEAAEREAAAEQKRQLAAAIKQQLPANLHSLADADPNAALKIWEQLNPDSDPQSLMNVGNGQIYNPNTGEWITAPNATIETPTLTTIYDENGREQKGYMQGGDFIPVGSPKATTERPEFNVSQATAAGYADRMAQADAVMTNPALVATQTDPVQVGAGNTPLVGNFLKSAEYQQAEQAQRDFINAILRRESGAVISESEFDSARRQYFPQPGDSETVLQQKAANRRNAINGVARAAGPAYTLPDTTNYLVDGPTGDGGAVSQPQTQEEYDALPSGAVFIDPDDGQTYRKP